MATANPIIVALRTTPMIDPLPTVWRHYQRDWSIASAR